MGEAQAGPVRLSFNPQLRVEFYGATVTSDAGLLLPRELGQGHRHGARAVHAHHHGGPERGDGRAKRGQGRTPRQQSPDEARRHSVGTAACRADRRGADDLDEAGAPRGGGRDAGPSTGQQRWAEARAGHAREAKTDRSYPFRRPTRSNPRLDSRTMTRGHSPMNRLVTAWPGMWDQLGRGGAGGRGGGDGAAAGADTS